MSALSIQSHSIGTPPSTAQMDQELTPPLDQVASVLVATSSTAPTGPVILSGCVTATFSPLAVWLKGSGFTSNTTVRVVDNVGNVWFENRAIVRGADGTSASFPLNARNKPPSGCNTSVSCTIKVSVRADPQRPYSAGFSITLPALTAEPKAVPGSASLNKFPLGSVRSVTYYNFQQSLMVENSSFVSNLERDIPRIKEFGFNTIWLIADVERFLNKDNTIHPVMLGQLRDSLALARKNNLRVMMPLAYSPTKQCDLLTKSAYDEYVRKNEIILKVVEDYANITLILYFSETVWECLDTAATSSSPYIGTVGGERLSVALKLSLGRLPLDIDPAIAKKFIFGYHDNFMASKWNAGTPSMEKGACFNLEWWCCTVERANQRR